MDRYGKTWSEAAQRKEKQTCAIEKPKLDNARRLRGIYFIDPADAEFKETIKKRAEKVRKFRCQQQCLAISGEERTRKLVAILMLPRPNTRASLKPTNLRESVWKELYIKIIKTTLQGKTKISYASSILKYQMRKQQWTKNGKKLEKIPAWQLTKVRNKKGGDR